MDALRPSLNPGVRAITGQKARTLRAIGLGVAAAALGTLLGFLLLIIYVVVAYQYWDSGSPRNCAAGTPAGLWALAISMFAGMLAASFGVAYGGARAWRLNLRLAMTLTGLFLLPAVVAGLLWIPAINDELIQNVCYG